jgi:phytoene dehydrogenase-like protein
MPWYRDLELRRHRAVYLEPEVNVALILPDGRSVQWWTEFDRTVDSFAELSSRDALALLRWLEEGCADTCESYLSRSLRAAAEEEPIPYL